MKSLEFSSLHFYPTFFTIILRGKLNFKIVTDPESARDRRFPDTLTLRPQCKRLSLRNMLRSLLLNRLYSKQMAGYKENEAHQNNSLPKSSLYRAVDKTWSGTKILVPWNYTKCEIDFTILQEACLQQSHLLCSHMHDGLKVTGIRVVFCNCYLHNMFSKHLFSFQCSNSKAPPGGWQP